MQYPIITIDQVHPDLREPVKNFLLKCKYPYVLVGVGGNTSPVTGDDPVETICFTYVGFIDPNNMDGVIAGGLRKAWIGRYNNRRVTFRIISRENQTEKHRYDNERRRSKETSDGKKVLNLMLKLIKPYTPQDVSEGFASLADREISNWRREYYQDGYRAFEELNASIVAEEVKHLVSLGVEFKTAAFKKLVDGALPKYEEYRRRGKYSPECYFVNIKEGKGIDVTKRGNDTFLEHYNKFEDMPKLLQEGVSLLKMLSDDEPMLPIGYKITSNTFWVFEGMEADSELV
jgi:hypothetical protein